MSNLIQSEKQQKLQNLLLVVNLYKNHKIHKEMVKLNEVSQEGFSNLQTGINNVNENVNEKELG